MDKGKKRSHALQVVVEVILFVMCVFVHLYKISEIPFGINIDEMGMGYDAWCLSNYGVDRYLNSYPVYLTNFGGGQSALYAYLCAFVLKFFDISAFSIRLPGILLFLIGVIFQYRLARFCGDNHSLRGFLTLFFMAILPVYIMLFRIGMDCNLMLAMTSIFFYYFIQATEEGKYKDFLASGVVAGLLLYTYAISYVVLILFLLVMIPYLFYTKKWSVTKMICFGMPLAVLAFPLILVQAINIFDMEELQIGCFTITKLILYRSGEIAFGNFSLQSVISCLKSIFLFDWLPYNSVAEFGTIYYFSIPFIMLGMIKMLRSIVRGIRKRTWKMESVFVVWFVLLLLLGCCMEANVNRLNGIYVSVLVFLIEGVVGFLEFFKQERSKRILVGIILMVYGGLFTLFLSFCFGGEYQKRYESLEFFEYSLDEVLEMQQEVATEKDRMVYIGDLKQAYIYYLGAMQMNPSEYLEASNIKEIDYDALSRLDDGFENYRFYLPEVLDLDAYYIVKRDQREYCERLENAGFTGMEIGGYNLYFFDIADFEKIEEKGMIHWNLGVDEGNVVSIDQWSQEIEGEDSLVFVGWSYNKGDQTTWDVMYFLAGDNRYEVELVERADVVEEMGNEDLLHTGLLGIIPIDQINDLTEIVLVCIDGENRKYYEENITLQWGE